ncbi:MAG: Gfo/Idh/MocA family oxidoreductase [Phycisphaerae bacterium]|nr:Gfo/Idh/MocA family oxidoreductase [Phycisphaerae bacterium]
MGRRQFLKGTASGLAVASALLSNGAQAAEKPAARPRRARPGANDRVVIGSIGVGDLGRRHHLANCLLPNERIEVAAVCDVDRNHRDMAAQMVKDRTGKRIGNYKDFRDLLDRKDIDAVVVVTPDHWHAIISIAAMEAGKDVYCEKPLTLTIDQGKAMVRTARRYGTVFQTGNMQRSDPRFRKACELVRNGKIGKITKVTTHIGGIDAGKWEPVQTPPAELDWNFWLGPAPYADYSPNRCHYQFRWFEDYSGGKMTDWGAHHNDIAQWGLGMDGTGPVKVHGKGTFHENGPHDVPGSFEVTYTYANGVELICHSEGENGAKFHGEDGWLFVNRSRIEASDPAILEIELGPDDVRLYNTGDDPNNWVNHYANWLDCMNTRERCLCDVEVGHRSATVCHLGNIAIKLGRELQWDPKAELFVNDDEANRMVSRPMRAPWHL